MSTEIPVMFEGGPANGEIHMATFAEGEGEWIKLEFAELEGKKVTQDLDYAWYRWTKITLPYGIRVYKYDPRAL